MKKFMVPLLLLLCFDAAAQQMDQAFKNIRKYMGVHIYGGYAHQTVEQASIGRFINSFNTVNAARLTSTLAMPTSVQMPMAGLEVGVGSIRTGYQYTHTPALEWEAAFTNGTLRKMKLEMPKHSWYIDMLMPLAKGRVFLGMTVGSQFGYYRLHSYLHHNFGIDTYANNDGISGVYKSNLDLSGRLGARMDININSRLGISLRADTHNKLINGSPSPISGWRDDFYNEATLASSRYRTMYLPEDVTEAHNDYITFGNVIWESNPAVWGDVTGIIYSATLNVKILSFSKK